MEKIEVDYTYRKVKNCSKGRILDLGCGRGFFCNYLQKWGFNVTAIDMNPNHLEVAKRINDKVEFIHDDITTLCLKRRYDTILLFSVMDYLVNVDLVEFLYSLKRFLNRNGRVLVCVSNSNSLQRRLKTLLGHEPVEKIPHYDFNAKRIREIIRQAGYNIVEFTSTKFWTLRRYRFYMPFDNLATEFFIVAGLKN